MSHAANESSPSASRPSRPLRVRWEGSLFVRHSLAHLNRELAVRLLARGHELALAPHEPDTFDPGEDPRWAALVRARGIAPSGPADVCVRHRWPPDFAPASGALAVMQHWEYGSLPRAWIAPLNNVARELWVATNWVRDGAIRSGVDAARVHVVRAGVDTQKFRPGVTPLALPTTKSFKFLFVGGTLPRKGIAVLLEAYGRAFTRADDVTLVLKDSGGGSFYQGQTLAARIAAFRAQADAPEVLHLERELRDADMPALFSACDAYVHPYLGEGFGLPIAEAMACGKPVAVTNHGAALDFCDASNAWLVPAREVRHHEARIGDLETVERPWYAEPDVDALVSILRELAARPASLAVRGAAARARIESAFTWEHAADDVETRLSALAVEPRGTSTQVAVPELRADAASAVPVEDSARLAVRWGGMALDFSGYARVSRLVLPELQRRGVDVQLDSYARDERFTKSLESDPAEARRWLGLLKNKVERGLYVSFHPAAGWNGGPIWSAKRRENPGFDAYAGFTMFETDRLPRGWTDEAARMDEVWVPSRFNLETFANAGIPREKLRLLQPGLDLAPWRADVVPLELEGEKRFTFLSVFQWTRRKGWDVLLDAWARAFGPEDDVRLVLRAYPGYRKDPPLAQRIDAHLATLGRSRADCAPIVLIERFVSEQDMPRLYAAADAFVLPTRGEGWGLPYLEAMAAGLPVIGTRWSGQLDFLDDATGYLIDVEDLEPVGAEMTTENAYYEDGHLWARPSVEHTAALMRRVFTERAEAASRASAARARVHGEWGSERSGVQFEAVAGDLLARTRGRGALVRKRRAQEHPLVLWNSPLFDPSGYADEARQFVLGLDALGIPVRAAPIDWIPQRAELERADAERLVELLSTPARARAIHVQHITGQHFKRARTDVPTVGRTMFETDGLPAEWVARANELDEVWVPSQFNVETFAEAGVERAKLCVVPGAIDAERWSERVAPLQLQKKRGFNFLCVCDWIPRKGWDVLVEAWARAFKATDDVALYFHVNSAKGVAPQQIAKELQQHLVQKLRVNPAKLASIQVLARPLSSKEMRALYPACDAFVLASRGEGWGRPYMEAMASGIPTIGTNWSGNTEFMTRDTSFLVDAELVRIPKHHVAREPWLAGQRWAQPNVEQLAATLKRVARGGADIAEIAARGREHVLTNYSREKAAEILRTRLAIVGAPRTPVAS